MSINPHWPLGLEQVALAVAVIAIALSVPVWLYSFVNMLGFHRAWQRGDEWRPECRKAFIGLGLFIILLAIGASGGLLAGSR